MTMYTFTIGGVLLSALTLGYVATRTTPSAWTRRVRLAWAAGFAVAAVSLALTAFAGR